MMWFLEVFLLSTFLANIQAQNNCDPEWSKTSVKIQQKNFLWNLMQNNIHKEFSVVDESTLRSVHVIFRHGDRTPDSDSLYPLDPYYNYNYYPIGFGQLTNFGKRQEYNIGIDLRERYSKFLGNVYTPDVIKSRSTDYDRTKMSLQLVLAGLWPPADIQRWNRNLLWQPIPYDYELGSNDQLLGDPYVACKRYRILRDIEKNSQYNQMSNEKLKPFYNYVQNNTGLNITNPEDIYNLFFTLFAEESLGFTLPEWTTCVWPKKITEVAVYFYRLMTQTPELLRLAVGQLMQNIIDNSNDSRNNTADSNSTKMYLYSGHERNVALILIALDVFQPQIPPYGSYVSIEFHEINSVYGFKVLYQDYEGKNPKLLTLPNCDTFCPYDKFYDLIKDKLPTEPC